MATYLYTRKSTEHSQENSHETQRAECEAYAQGQGLIIDAIFEDTSSGGVAPYERPAFSELLDQLGAGDVIITWKRDRLGRTVIENAVTEKIIRKMGADLISLDAVTGDTPEAIMMRTLLDAFAEYEKALISKRTRATLRAKKARGEVTGNTPLGFKANEKGMVVSDLTEQAKLEHIIQARAQGLTYRALQELCEREGITSRSGHTPSIQTLANWCKGVSLTQPIKRKAPGPSDTKRQTKPSVTETHPQLVFTVLDLRDKGLSSRGIAQELTARGYTTARGGALQKTQVLRILKRVEAAQTLQWPRSFKKAEPPRLATLKDAFWSRIPT